MTISIHTTLEYDFLDPVDVLLQLEAAMIPEQIVHSAHIAISPVEHFARVDGHDMIGERIWLPSRYCPSDKFEALVEAEFGNLDGGPRIAAIRDWIAGNFTYCAGASHAGTDAIDSYVTRQGVCRDYAHVLVAFARASTIPARFVSVYAPDVKPQDFHAVAEVFLDGAWHLVDPTGMAEAADMVKIGVGRDAADVSFLTSYGRATLITQTVDVTRLA
jgi:transglutaminase-like putative cysteine protease